VLYSAILVLHICAGTVGLCSGTAAMCFRKGSPRHVQAGKVFVASMLIMGVGAVYLGIVKDQPSNIGGGIITFYLIGTGWLTARRREGETSRMDWVALLVPLSVGIFTWVNGIAVLRSGATSQNGVPVGMSFFMGSICLLAAGGRRSHASARRDFWSKAHRPASLADVFWAVHRSRVIFHGTLEPPPEIAFGSGAGATPALGAI
jgi:hypothetical protein